MEETTEFTAEGLEELRSERVDLMRSLAMDNVGIAPLDIMAIRLETFADTFLDAQSKLVFEYNFERRIIDLLQQMSSQAARSKLMAGVNSNSPDIKSLLQGK